jgi:hypothetical protein
MILKFTYLKIAPKCSKDANSSDEIGLAWDAICFLVLLLQRRLYMSHMFQHVVNEYKAQSVLAARGAAIFRIIINHKVEMEKQRETRVLEKLKSNVERIRQHQSKAMKNEPELHFDAIRAGDYYMFDEDCEIESESDLDLDHEEQQEYEFCYKDSIRKKSKDKETTSTTDLVDNAQVNRETLGLIQSEEIRK